MVSEEIIKVLDDLARRFGIAIDWSSENVMPYITDICDRFISWNIATSVVWLVIAVLWLIFLLWRVIDKLEGNDFDGDDASMYLTFSAPGIIVTLVQVFDIIKCKYLPELVIYEYLVHMIDKF